MADHHPPPFGDLDPTEIEILRLIRALRYGSIEIQIHDARVVQIERRERLRFDRDRPGPAAA